MFFFLFRAKSQHEFLKAVKKKKIIDFLTIFRNVSRLSQNSFTVKTQASIKGERTFPHAQCILTSTPKIALNTTLNECYVIFSGTAMTHGMSGVTIGVTAMVMLNSSTQCT